MDYTLKEIIAAVFSSGGIIGGLISIFVFITSRLDARRKRNDEIDKTHLESAVEMRQLILESSGKQTDLLVENLWKLVNEKEVEIKQLKTDLEASERAGPLKKPVRMKIYECIRKIRNEMDSLNIMLLNEEETNVFARRWGNVKVIIGELEKALSDD